MSNTGVAGVQYSSEPQSAANAISAGVVLFVIGIGGALGVMWLTGTFYFWFLLIAVAGFASIARGIMLARRR
ncbi:MAG: hypothetical protein IPK82_01565 [Polyangiaceae bacterium]|nr:hypothetical protein [Polyangiaceae bacterium]